MNQVVDRTIETPTTPAEVGNLASVVGLTHDKADYGIITGLFEDGDVKVTWYKKAARKHRAHRENKNNRAVTRILHDVELESVLAQ